MVAALDKNQPPDNAKLAELILLVAQLSEDDEKFGAVKLNKLLCYADFTAYRQLGKSITGQTYFRNPKGPCARRLLPIRTKMKNAGECTIVKTRYHGHTQQRLIALRDPDRSVFTEDELVIVEQIVQTHWGKNARKISDDSHKLIGWQAANHGENIPYAISLLDQREPTAEEFEFADTLEPVAREVLSRHGHR